MAAGSNAAYDLPLPRWSQVDDNVVGHERLEQGARESDVALAGTAGQVQQHRVVGVGGADRDRLRHTAQLDLRQLGDRSGDGRTGRHPSTGGTVGGMADDHGQAGDEEAQPSGRPKCPSGERRPSQRAADCRAEHQRQDRNQAMEATRRDEGGDAIDGVEANRAKARAHGAHAGKLVGDDVGEREDE